MRNIFNTFNSARLVSAISFTTIEPELNTGDVILFARTGPDSLLARLGPWHNSSTAGFLIRDRDGLEGLRLCHPNLTRDPSQGNTELTSLRQFLTESDFDTIVVRKLWEPLQPQQSTSVIQFSQDCVGQLLNRKVTLLMQRTDIPSICICAFCLNLCSKTVERFICSELVVKMLITVGKIEGVNNEYYPIQSTVKCGRRWRIYGPSIFVRTSAIS
eukprot:g3920.t1